MTPKPEKSKEAPEASKEVQPEITTDLNKPDELTLLAAQAERERLEKEVGSLPPLLTEMRRVLGSNYTGDRDQDFYNCMLRLALKYGDGIPPAVIAGQAIFEAGDGGRSDLCARYLNPFGRKAGPGQAATPLLSTSEEVDGRLQASKANFCRFDSLEDAVREQCAYLRRRYPQALNHKDDPEAFLRALLEGGYATLNANEYVHRVKKRLHKYGGSLESGPAASVKQEKSIDPKDPNAFEKAWDSIKEASSQTWDGLKEMGTSLWDGIKSLGIKVLTALGLDEYFLKEVQEKPVPPSSPTAVPYEDRHFSSKEVLDSDAKVFSFPSSASPIVTSRQGHREDPVAKKKGIIKDSDHKGIDIAVPEGTPFIAMQEGVVVDRHVWTGKGQGNSLTVLGKDGYYHTYHHLARPPLPNHTKVKPGDVLGYVGTTGYSTGPHLHYQVKNASGQLLSAEDFLPERYRAA